MNIAVFASGAGTNARNIIEYFRDRPVIVKLIITNNQFAGVIKIADEFKIPILITSSDFISEKDLVLRELNNKHIDLIVLAGFLKKIPSVIVESFRDRIINIHPALLPKYGGKGMYGMKVHQSVLHQNEKYTGITIHYVNENYDEGNIILQKEVLIEPQDDAESIASKVHKLEYIYYPQVIESLLYRFN